MPLFAGPKQGSDKVLFNPLRILTLGVALNLFLAPVLGSMIWDMYLNFKETTGRSIKLQRLAGTITNLNETLTMSARLYAVTGNEKWRDKYKSIEPKLDDALTEVALVAREDYERNYASQAKLAYTKLIEMENLALALVKTNRKDEAYHMLSTPNYHSQKKLYTRAIDQLSQAIGVRASGKIDRFYRELKYSALLGLVSMGLLVGSWLGVIALVRRHLVMRRIAEQALNDEKERLQVTLNSIAEGVITTDIRGKISSMNPVAEKLTGWGAWEAIGLPLEEVFRLKHPGREASSQSLASRVLKACAPLSLYSGPELISRDESRRTISQTAAPILDAEGKNLGVVLVFKDISEELRLQDEALKSDKLESLGTLAGGIAHDFNNFLTSIAGNISLLQKRLPECDKASKLTDEAIRACEMARGLTGQLLTFSKGWTPIRKKALLKHSLPGWVEFAARGQGVSKSFHCDPDLHVVEIDEGQINQVVSNLIINACQAMPAGGEIEVRASNCSIPSEDTRNIPEGDYICVQVMDQGIGIDGKYLKRIFDPYFTTKPFGNGLGLATSYSVIKAHGGYIDVESTPGAGTIFRVYLPACKGNAPELAPTKKCEIFQEARILFMDDDEAIREVVSEALISLGYDVDLAGSGEEAVKVFKNCHENGEPYDLLIMDLTVKGGMGGKDAIAEIRNLNPAVKAIVSSGYSNDPVMGDFSSFGFNGALTKPFTIDQLADAVAKTLRNGSNLN